jgi:hypothetical protein
MKKALLVDATSIYAFQQYLKDHDFPVQGNPDYAALLRALEQEFPSQEFDPKLAFVAIDFDNEGQRKFCSFLQRLDFIVDPSDYRDAFVMPDRSTQYQRLSTRLTYAAGLLSASVSDFVVVTDAFDVYYPLVDLAQARKRTVTVAFFRSGLEPRWQRAGMFKDDSPVKFVDLDRYAKPIIGADLGTERRTRIEHRGLASLKL